MAKTPIRRTLCALVALGLFISACDGGDDVSPTSSPSPAPTTTAAPVPPATTTTTMPVPPAAPTTTLPPTLEPQVLTLDIAGGRLASYEGTVELITSYDGADGALFFGTDGAEKGTFTTTTTGRQRHLILSGPSAGSIEIIEDYTAEDGTVVSVVSETRSIEDMTRDELLDFKPSSPPVVVDRSAIGAIGPSAAPAIVGSDLLDPLAVAALIGPPLTDVPVDDGDSWSHSFDVTAIGPVSIDSEITGEEGDGADDPLVHVIAFTGRATDLPQEMSLREGLGAFGLNDLLLNLQAFAGNAAASVELQSSVVEGEVRFDPQRGIATAYDTSAQLSLLFNIDFGDTQWQWSVRTETKRSVVLTDVGPAAPFDTESVLDRFEFDPFELAALELFGLTRYDLSDAAEEQIDAVLDLLLQVTNDLFAGLNIVRVSAGEESVIAVAVTNGGDFRGDPIVGEGVAEFLSASRPRQVRVGGQTAFRVEIDGEEWLFYNNEAYLYIVIGSRDLATDVMTLLANAPSPYQWQEGDCLDFTDDFASETPYAPFGLHGLRHCNVPHAYEVIYSEVLPEGPEVGFPADIPDRSQRACGRAFNDFTGTTELESSIGMIRYLPDEDEWDKGARYLACVVFVSQADGRAELTERLDGRAPEYALALDVGVCLFGFEPVACDSPHTSEIIAVLELPHGPGAERPDSADIQATMAEQCDAVLADFTLGEGPGVVEVRDLSDVLTAWEFGARRYFCVAIAFGPDGFRLEITGTFADGWEEAAERVVT